MVNNIKWYTMDTRLEYCPVVPWFRFILDDEIELLFLYYTLISDARFGELRLMGGLVS